MEENVTVWAADTDYGLYDIVIRNGNFFYCVDPHTSGAVFAPLKWRGMINYNSVQTPHFFWPASANFLNRVDLRRERTIYFDGTIVEVPEGINEELKETEIAFFNRGIKEFIAIRHFLRSRKKEPFVYIGRITEGEAKLYTCRQMEFNLIDVNTFNMKIAFTEYD